MYELTLEKKLESLGKENERYKRLWEIYCYNKNLICEKLKHVEWFYFQYSKHDQSHSERIIISIERLLGDKGIECLSATDIYLILLSAYLHDYSMALDYNEVMNLIVSNEFNSFLQKAKKSEEFEQDVKNVTQEILAEKTNLEEQKIAIIKSNKDDNSWTIKCAISIYRLVAQFNRSSHGARSSSIIIDRFKRDEININPNNIFPDRIEVLLSEIVWMHQRSISEIDELLIRDGGIFNEEIHPRFLAFLLRIGDLLDLDSNRYNEMLVKDYYPLSSDSLIHYEKHHSVKKFLISPTEIYIEAQSSKEEVVRSMREWCDWIQLEITNFRDNIYKFIPENWNIRAPHVDIRIVKQGSTKQYCRVNINMRIDDKKAFELITGYSIYNDSLAFLREYLQNCIDASKIKLWLEICQEKKVEDSLNLTKQDYQLSLTKEILNGEHNCKISKLPINVYVFDFHNINFNNLEEVKLDKILEKDDGDIDLQIIKIRTILSKMDSNIFNSNLNEDVKKKIIKEKMESCSNKVVVIFEDFGIGISEEVLNKRILIPGTHTDCQEIDKATEGIVQILKPTGSFGIGIHSAFMVSEKVIFVTKSMLENKGINEIVVHSSSHKGWVEYNELQNDFGLLPTGTKTFIFVDPEKIDKNPKYIDYECNESNYYGRIINSYLNGTYNGKLFKLNIKLY